MGESQSGGRDSRQTEFDNGGWVEEFFGGNDSSAFTYSPPSTPSYGMSPGAMGGRQPNTVPDVQPSRYGRSFDPGVYSEPEISIVPSFDGPMGSGASTNAAVRDLQRFGSGIAALTGGSRPDQTSSPSYTSSSSTSGTMPTVQGPADRRMSFAPSGGTGVSPEQVRSERMFAEPASSYVSPIAVSDFLGGNYDVTDPYAPMGSGMETRSNLFPAQLGGGQLPTGGFQNIMTPDRLGDPLIYAQDRPIDRRPRPDPNEIANALTVPPYDINNLEAGRPGGSSGLGQSPGAMGGRYFPVKSGLTGATDDPFAPPTRPGTDFFGEGTLGSLGGLELKMPLKKPSAAAMLAAGAKDPKSDQDFSFRKWLGNLVKGFGSGVTDVGQFISSLTPGKLAEYAQQFLRGDPNYKGPSAAQLQLAQVPGPGPYVGGGVPSPSGVGGAPSPIQCPSGFKFDPVQNVCVPIVAPKPPVATPPVTTTPAPKTTAATGGISAIPNVYPFTLTPPIGAPIGNIAPVRS